MIDHPSPEAPVCKECGCQTGGGEYCYQHKPYTIYPKVDGSYYRSDGRRVDCECPAAQRDAAAALTASAASPADQGWEPIETAPQDTPVLTYRGAGLMAVAEHIADPRRWPKSVSLIWCCTDGVELLDVTHWRPLPPAPLARVPQE